MKKKLLLIPLLVSWAGALGANPFKGSDNPAPVIYGGQVPQWIRDTAFYLQSQIAQLSRQVMVEQNWGAFWSALGFAFVFGMVHIAGPGHGKVFTLAYFSSEKSRLGTGLLYSGLINLVDSLSAGLTVFLSFGVFRLLFSQSSINTSFYLQVTAYSLIALLGIIHLISHLKPHDHHREVRREGAPFRLALAVGLIPCPVSTALLVYGLANGILPFMILMVAGVSLGGFVVMSLLAVLVIKGRQLLVARAAHRWKGLLFGLEILSSGVIILFALLMVVHLVLG